MPGIPSLLNTINEKPVHLVVSHDRTKPIKRGHPWIFADSLQAPVPHAKPGSLALLKTRDGDIIAKGFYDQDSKIAFRALALKERLDHQLLLTRLEHAAALRARLFDPAVTDGFRLLNGEGDGLPGLVVDVYRDAAVVKLDGAGPEGFYNTDALAAWLQHALPHLRTVFLKHRAGDSRGRGRLLAGDFPRDPILFWENTLEFQADIVQGQKTGFFLDQRENRQRLGRLCRGARVLNLFGYTGGFSVYAGRGGAAHVTTVDVSQPALEVSTVNWQLNGLSPSKHEAEAADAFEFLEAAAADKRQWDVVVVDPPSFAPSKASVERAQASYERLFALSAQVTSPRGVLALSSCSSHIPCADFMQLCRSAVCTRARRRAHVMHVGGQPEDHPWPLACEELRYLKFNVFGLL